MKIFSMFRSGKIANASELEHFSSFHRQGFLVGHSNKSSGVLPEYVSLTIFVADRDFRIHSEYMEGM